MTKTWHWIIIFQYKSKWLINWNKNQLLFSNATIVIKYGYKRLQFTLSVLDIMVRHSLFSIPFLCLLHMAKLCIFKRDDHSCKMLESFIKHLYSVLLLFICIMYKMIYKLKQGISQEIFLRSDRRVFLSGNYSIPFRYVAINWGRYDVFEWIRKSCIVLRMKSKPKCNGEAPRGLPRLYYKHAVWLTVYNTYELYRYITFIFKSHSSFLLFFNCLKKIFCLYVPYTQQLPNHEMFYMYSG